jgi:hypothetical protein
LRLLELAVHDLQGTPLDASTYLGHFMNDEGGPIHRAPWMVSPYFGSLAFGLAIVGGALHRARWARAMAVVALAFALIALGRHTPVFAGFFTAIPGADLFRYPAKYFAVVALAGALLAAAGLDRVVAGEARSLRRLLIGVAVAAGAMGLAALAVTGAMDGAAMRTVRGALLAEALLLVAVALGLLLCERRAPRLVGPALAAAVAVQLAIANLPIVKAADPSLYSQPAHLAGRAVADAPPGEWPRVLADPALFRHAGSLSAADPEKAAFQQKEALTENIGTIFGVAYPMPYSATLDAAHREWIASTEDMQREALDLYGIRYLVLPSAFRVTAAHRLESLAGVEDLQIRLYRNRTARPFAYPASAVVSAAGLEQARAAVHTAEVTLELGAVIEALDDAAGGGAGGSCSAEEKPLDEIALRCELDAPGWVIVNAAFHRGWRAEVDGEATAIRRANAMVMAVRVGAGPHAVRLVYREPRLAAGGWLALLAGAVCLVLFALEVVLARRRARQRPRTRS